MQNYCEGIYFFGNSVLTVLIDRQEHLNGKDNFMATTANRNFYHHKFCFSLSPYRVKVMKGTFYYFLRRASGWQGRASALRSQMLEAFEDELSFPRYEFIFR